MTLWLCLGLGSADAADEPLWFDHGRPGPQARQAVELLTDSASHGLEPQDYAAGTLLQAVTQASQGAPLEPAAIEPLEQALTTAMQRYLADLHGGRIDPRDIHHRYTPPRHEAFDAGAYLRAALAARALPEAAAQAAPRLPLYERLREALKRYRGLVDDPAWQPPLPPLPVGKRGGVGKLEPGQAYAGLAPMAQRLVALGDLAQDTPVPPLFDGPLVEAVKSFQQRHGLAPDGVIGKATLAHLQVPPAARVRQIELMLERLRWTPLMQGPRMVVINIPEFVLRAYEVRGERIGVEQEMKVIVGRALDTRTPLFDADMRFIEFSPYWNVPASIARAETVPRLRRDPGYFEREGFEFVAPDGGVHTTLSAETLDALSRGQWRIRQRPGQRNALGDIKFVFPNDNRVFLHHTPATRLFERDRRDFSHGCIRVEDPVALARFVLQDMPDWTEDRIRKAMAKGESTTLQLAEPVRVLITYGTALVKAGRIHFFDDIYGLDRLLDAALRQRAPDQPKLN
ncbi:MAG: L,D-transpeptidase family protein [Rubrivivax sp.]|nr:L,D-transpeptidase family protein [Rubrivivax sp.]